MVTKRWQDWANLLLGLWLFVSPWMLQYPGSIAAWNAYALGAAVVVFAAFAAYMSRLLEEAITELFGVWLVVSPFVLDFTPEAAIALHTVVIGMLVIAFAVWAMCSDRALYERWRGSHPV